jgi:hypothetical protein
VARTRFAAPRFVLIFGMSPPSGRR